MALYVMKQQVMTLIPWLIAVYAAICAVVYFGNRLFMYFPNQTRAAPAEAGLDHVKEIEIAAADQRCLQWVISGHNGSFASCPLYPRKRTFVSVEVRCPLCATSRHLSGAGRGQEPMLAS